MSTILERFAVDFAFLLDEIQHTIYVSSRHLLVHWYLFMYFSVMFCLFQV